MDMDPEPDKGQKVDLSLCICQEKSDEKIGGKAKFTRKNIGVNKGVGNVR